MATLPPLFNAQFTGATGLPAAGYLLYAYTTGTTTPKDTYADQGEVATNPNPITLDASGRCSLWLGSGEYALELRTPANALVKRWDDVAGVSTPEEGDFVPLAGGVTMTGRFNLAGAAQAALQPVTLQQMQAALAAIDAVTASSLAAMLAALLPAGAVIIWSGSVASIPAGWVLCNGSNATPDLRDRFVFGAGGASTVGTTGGIATATTASGGAHVHTGTAASHVLTTAEMPAHTHTESGGVHTDYGYVGPTSGASSYEPGRTGSSTASTGGGGGHTHDLSIDSGGAHTHTVAILPPFYALCFIMKSA